MHLLVLLLIACDPAPPPEGAPTGPAGGAAGSGPPPAAPTVPPTGVRFVPGEVPSPLGPLPPEPDRSVPEGGWPAPADVPGCPSGMARVDAASGAFCIQRFEVALAGQPGPLDRAGLWPDDLSGVDVTLTSAAGEVPSTGVSWYQAHAACRTAGLHLCTSTEWQAACESSGGGAARAFPTDGDPRTACNVGHPEGRLRASGGSPGCVTPEGVYDLEGNLWEWTDPEQVDAAGVPRIDKRGGGYYTNELAPCAKAAVGTHPPQFEGTIGFRCCTAAD